LRIILITSNGYGHRYVANKLAGSLELAGIVVDHGKRPTRVDRLRQLRRRYSNKQLVSRLLIGLYRLLLRDAPDKEQSMISVLGSESCRSFSKPSLVHEVFGINTAEGVRVVEGLDPDIVLVFGTGIVGRKVLSTAKQVALNMHTGISPYYRGCDCAFWPIHNDELDMIGATVHECTQDVDGGRIFATRRARLHAGDGMHAAFARAIATGAELFVETVSKVLRNETVGTPQDLRVGREYKAYMRDLSAERKVRSKIAQGVIRKAFQ
jgi:methionyl-tRNA formyltransferase